jgi:hypothetical protein
MIIEIDRKPAVHDKVLVETQIDGKVIGFRAVVVNVQAASLWLGLVRPDSLLAQVQRDQVLHLTFRRENAALVAVSAFISHLGSRSSRIFSIEWLADTQMIQRRAHVRLDYECPVYFKFSTQPESAAAGRKGRGITRNISAGGIQFRDHGATDLEPAVGDQLELEVPISTTEVVSAEAEVVRVESTNRLPGSEGSADGRDGPQALIAARFVTISDVDQDRIVRLIFTVQRQRREAPHKPA